MEACKWVDEVVRGAPYTTDLDVMEAHLCDLCVHGDDLVTNSEGIDTYHAVKAAGKFAECRRTECISTTQLIKRMLGHDFIRPPKSPCEDAKVNGWTTDLSSGYAGRMLPSTRLITQFSLNPDGSSKDLKDAKHVVYVAGSFDLFHLGHIELLRAAREAGDYVLVGIYEDCEGAFVMNLFERTLGVLSCKVLKTFNLPPFHSFFIFACVQYVDEVIMGAPVVISHDFIQQCRIAKVLGSNCTDPQLITSYEADGIYPIGTPKDKGIYEFVKHDHDYLTTQSIVGRVQEQQQAYLMRNLAKEAKEANPHHHREMNELVLNSPDSLKPTNDIAKQYE